MDHAAGHSPPRSTRRLAACPTSLGTPRGAARSSRAAVDLILPRSCSDRLGTSGRPSAIGAEEGGSERDDHRRSMRRDAAAPRGVEHG